MKPYAPVPVEAARQIAVRFEKHVVVILAYDAVHGKVHTTSYGTDPEAKIYAANLADAVTRLATDSDQREVFQDFRGIDAAANAAKAGRLQEVVDLIKVELGYSPDGAVLLRRILQLAEGGAA